MALFLATCPAEECREAARAILLAKKALKRQPKDPLAWGVLGVAQYRAGEMKASTASMEKAMEFSAGGDPRMWFFLAMAYWRSNHQAQSRKWYEKSIGWIDKNHSADEEFHRFRAEAEKLLKP